MKMQPNARMNLLPSILDRLRRYCDNEVDELISPHDNMFQAHRREHYFSVGRDAISIVAQAMIKANVAHFGTVLDLPCRSGRVLRHLVRFLPESSVIASDIDPAHVSFCSRQFGALPLVSSEHFGEVAPDRPIDLLWCGSLLTHLPAEAFKNLLRHAIRWLAPNGIAILTLHGRWTIRRQTSTQYKYMDEVSFAPILDGIRKDGFGYTNYARAESRLGQDGDGHNASLPSWVMRTVETIEEARLLDYQERGWDNHQDVLVLRKSPIGAWPWLFEESLKPSTDSGGR